MSAFGAGTFRRAIAGELRFGVAIFGDGSHHLVAAEILLLRRIVGVAEVSACFAETYAHPILGPFRHIGGVRKLGLAVALIGQNLAAEEVRTDRIRAAGKQCGQHFGWPRHPHDIAAISEIARSHKMKMHMDGARFANALVALGASPADMTWKSGVDVLSFGGSKNGCLAAEAVLSFNPELAKSMPYLHKRSVQLLSKMRFVAAQLSAYLDGDLWLDDARNANAMAARLSEGLAALPGLELAFARRSNEVFVRMPPTLVERLQQDGMSINDDEVTRWTRHHRASPWSRSARARRMTKPPITMIPAPRMVQTSGS